MIHLYASAWNQIDLIPYFFKHYLEFVDHVFLYDNASDDGTREYIAGMPRTTLSIIDSENTFREDKLLYVKNEEWKKLSRNTDWVICCDIDEFVYHPNIFKFLDLMSKNKVSLLQPYWYDMVSKDFPYTNKKIPDTQLYDIVKEGVLSTGQHKTLIFNPKLIEEINYTFGSHHCLPKGFIRLCKDAELKTLHYQKLGLEKTWERYTQSNLRNSQFNKDRGLAIHYSMSRENFDKEFEKYYNDRTKAL